MRAEPAWREHFLPDLRQRHGHAPASAFTTPISCELLAGKQLGKNLRYDSLVAGQ